MPEKTYLGDAVYVEFDGYQFKLTTTNGQQITNTIVLQTLEHLGNYLEPAVFRALEQYVEAVRDATSRQAG
jgi:hypothetical protein